MIISSNINIKLCIVHTSKNMIKLSVFMHTTFKTLEEVHSYITIHQQIAEIEKEKNSFTQDTMRMENVNMGKSAKNHMDG